MQSNSNETHEFISLDELWRVLGHLGRDIPIIERHMQRFMGTHRCHLILDMIRDLAIENGSLKDKLDEQEKLSVPYLAREILLTHSKPSSRAEYDAQLISKLKG